MTKHKHPALIVAITVAWIIAGFLLAPIFVTVPLSLTPDRFLSFPQGEITFQHYAAIATNNVWLSAIRDSVVVGIFAMILASLAGTAAAIGLWMMNSRLSRFLGFLPVLPLVVPSIVSALALGRAWAQLGLLDSYIATIVTHALVGLPFVFMTVSAALEGFDRNLVNAARSLGTGPVATILQVIVPNLKVAMASGAIFAFMTSWDEVVLTSFVTARNVQTLPKKIFADIQTNLSPEIAAISTAMIAITLLGAAVYFARHLTRRTPAPKP